MTYSRKAEGVLRYTNQSYYKMGKQASRILAFQLRKEQSNRIVPKIRHPTSLAEVSHPVEVAEVFQTFYKNLYDAPDEAPNAAEIEGIFQDLNLVKLSKAEAEELTVPVLESEIEENHQVRSITNLRAQMACLVNFTSSL